MRSPLLLFIGFIFLIASAIVSNNILVTLIFLCVGALLIIFGYYDLKISNKKGIEDLDMIIELNKRSYRKEAVKVIEVVLEDCQIISRDQYISIDRSNHKEAQMIDSVFKAELSETTKNIKSQILKYRYGKKVYYSTDINIDKDNLKIKLYLQKKTKIYFKDNNFKEYFFDLDFLKE